MGFFEDIGNEIIDAINNLLSGTGKWTSSVLDSAAKLYNRFLDTAYKLITKDIDDKVFSDFWNVIDYVSSVIVAVSSVMLIMMFLYTLVNSSLESRQEVNMNMLVLDFIKLLFCNFIISKAVDIVIGIFTFGTKLATACVSFFSADNFTITDPNRGLGDDIKDYMEKGVSGLTGLFVLIIAIIGAVVMVGSALMIILEIYKRFFKIFCLIPFASISFSTAVMSDNDGKEIFKGYVKGIISTSIEAVVIVLCMAFCASITVNTAVTSGSEVGGDVNNTSFMATLFDFEDDMNLQRVKINNKEEYEICSEYIAFVLAINNSFFDDASEEFQNYMKLASEDIPEVVRGIVPDFNFVRYEFPNGFNKLDLSTSSSKGSISQPNYPIYVVFGKSLSLGSALILVIQAIFPMVLTAGAIKEAPQYASRVLGMG